MGYRKEMVGKTFNYLTPFQFDGVDKRGQAKWLCNCICGGITSVNGNALRYGRTKSCGCKKSPRRDMAGQTFNHVKVIKFDCVDHNRQARWWCECLLCGKTFSTLGNSIARGTTKSCGCLKTENRDNSLSYAKPPITIKHGHSTRTEKSPTYRSWLNMIQRCNNPKATQYEDYGGRGIKVCEHWSYGKYENFLADMGPRPAGKTIDRIDNDGNYEPGNCRWATPHEQHINTRYRRTK